MSDLPAALLEPIPAAPDTRIARFARDLALGVLHQLWSNSFMPKHGSDSAWQWSSEPTFQQYMDAVWRTDEGSNAPTPELMILARYMDKELTERQLGNNPQKVITTKYLLTPRAYDLLGTAASQVVSPFISYKRHTSSAIAMMIWSYLQRFGVDCFLDIHAITLGDDWQNMLDTHLESSTSIIAVITRGTLDSEYVRYELDWALGQKKRIIPVLHGGYTNADLAHEFPQLITYQTRLINHPEESAQLLAVLQDLRVGLGVSSRGLYRE